ncbi:MAG TPA: oligosaccharide flippase family protein [Caulobacter sp.]|nr:oligosaccharide flippase family protein [Caulobacter sp.]
MSNHLYMAASVLIRMVAGLLVFTLLARGLGPGEYGVVATVFSYATLASLLTDFGLASKTLRDIGEDRERGGAILNSSLSVKSYLTLIVMAVGILVLVFMPGSRTIRLASGLFGSAILIGTIGDMALVAFRGMGRFSRETWITASVSTVHLLVVGSVSMLSGNILLVSAAFIASRVIYSLIAIGAAEKLFSGTPLRPESLRNVWVAVRGAWGWAVDSGLGYLTSQIDGILVAAMFGLHSAGIYQSGSRFIQAALGLVVILAAVHIPALAKASKETVSIGKGERRMMIEFLCAGVGLGVIFWAGGPLITRFLLGGAYKEVDSLWFSFAVFVCLRYLAAALGTSLTARGVPITRIMGQLAALVVIAIGFASFVPGAGLGAVPWIMSAGALSTLLSYCVARILIARGGARPAA